MAYLTCPFCPAAALQSLRTPSKFPACGIVIFTCISGHKFYVDEESLNGKDKSIAATWLERKIIAEALNESACICRAEADPGTIAQ